MALLPASLSASFICCRNLVRHRVIPIVAVAYIPRQPILKVMLLKMVQTKPWHRWTRARTWSRKCRPPGPSRMPLGLCWKQAENWGNLGFFNFQYFYFFTIFLKFFTLRNSLNSVLCSSHECLCQLPWRVPRFVGSNDRRDPGSAGGGKCCAQCRGLSVVRHGRRRHFSA